MLQKIEHYISALAQLEQAVAIYQKSQQDMPYLFVKSSAALNFT